MGLGVGMVKAWKRSQPIDWCPTGAPREVLRKIHDHDPAVVLRWDPEVEDVAVFRSHPDYSIPVLQFFCRPYGLPPMVDNRLYLAMVAGDRAKMAGRDEHDTAMRDVAGRLTNAENGRKQATQAKLDSIDYEKTVWLQQKMRSAIDGNPRGLFSQVPGEVTT
jgi:hypothetical protein